MRILLAGDQALLRGGLACLLQHQYPSVEIEEVAVFSKVITLMKQSPSFDIALLDFKLPGSDGAISVKDLHQRHPETPLMVMAELEDRAFMEQVMEYGAMGFICKRNSSAADFLKAVNLVLRGDVYISPKTLRRDPMAAARSSTIAPVDRRRQNTNEFGLTERQMQILHHLAAGLSNREIATTMGLAEGTVKVHVAAAYQMLRVNSRTEAVRVAEQLGLLGVTHG